MSVQLGERNGYIYDGDNDQVSYELIYIMDSIPDIPIYLRSTTIPLFILVLFTHLDTIMLVHFVVTRTIDEVYWFGTLSSSFMGFMDISLDRRNIA